jgi:hypothetical protein
MQSVRKQTHTILWLLVVVLVAGWAGESRAQFMLYDDFTGADLDPTKWRGQNRGQHLESVKRIQNGRLLLGNFTYGESSSDSGRSTGRTGVQVADSSNIIGLAARLTVLAASSEDCAANDSGARASAQLGAAFFNVGLSTGPDDRTGDVLSRIQLNERDGIEKVIDIRLEQCTDPDCDTFVILASRELVTTWDLGETHLLVMQWDPDADQVLFRADAEFDSLSYVVPDSDPASSNGIGKRLRVRNHAENCTTGANRLSSFVVLVDDVFVLSAP